MTNEDPARRRWRAHKAGAGAETWAATYLRLKGWRVLARRFLVKGGEIDLVIQRGTTLAFVEVKHRAKLDDAMISIDAAKRRRMARAARVFVARRHLPPSTVLRADALYLAPWRWPVHVAAAFELDLD